MSEEDSGLRDALAQRTENLAAISRAVMRHLRQTEVARTGPVPPAEVWERYAVYDRWPTWAPHLTGVQAERPVLAAGSSGTVVAAYVLRVAFRVVAVDAPSRWAWVVRLGPIRLRLEHTVQPVSLARPHPATAGTASSGTTAGLRIIGPPVIPRLYAPVAWWALGRLVRP